MNNPIIKLNELTPNPRHAALLERWFNNPSYRDEINTFKIIVSKQLKKEGFTKAETERILNNVMKWYIVHPYYEEKTSGGIYDIDAMQGDTYTITMLMNRQKWIENHWS